MTERRILVIRAPARAKLIDLDLGSPYRSCPHIVVLGDGNRTVSADEIEQVYQALPKGSPIVLDGPALIVDGDDHCMMIGTTFQWSAHIPPTADGKPGMAKDELKANAELGIALSTRTIIRFLAQIGAPIVVLNSNDVDVLVKAMHKPNVQKQMPSIDLVLLTSAPTASANDLALGLVRKSQASLLSQFYAGGWGGKPAEDSRVILELFLKYSAVELFYIQHVKNSKTTISSFKAPRVYEEHPLAVRLREGCVDGVPVSQTPWTKLGPLSSRDQLCYAHSLLVARAGDNDVEAVQRLLQWPEVKEVINIHTSFGETALVSCALNGSLEMFNALMQTGNIDVNLTVGTLNPLQMALRAGHLDIFKALLSHPGIDINFKNEKGLATIDVAIIYKNYEAVELLLQRKELQLANSFALLNAIEAKDIEIVRKLLARPGVDVNAENGAALSKAIEIGFEEGVRELLRHPSQHIFSDCVWLALTHDDPSFAKILLLDKRLVIDGMLDLRIKMFFSTFAPEIQQLLPAKYRKSVPLQIPGLKPPK